MIPGFSKFYSFLLILFIILIGVVIYLLLLNSNKQSTIQGFQQKELILKQEVTVWRDQDGKSRAEAKAISADVKVLKEVFEDNMEEIRKDIKGLKPKNLNSRTEVKTILKDSFQAVLFDSIIYINDSSVRFYSFNYQDSSGYNKYTGFIVNGKITIEPEVIVPLTATIYRKRKDKKFWLDFFPGRETVVQGKSDNSKVTITDIEAIVVKEKKGFFRRLF